MSTSFGFWNESSQALHAGLNTINLDSSTNIVKVINEDILGSVLYLSTHSGVTQNMYEEKVETGASTSLVRTRALGTAYIFNPSPNTVNVTMIEIQTDDISFIFNASNQINIAGFVQSDGIKSTDFKQAGDRALYVLDSETHARLDALLVPVEGANDLTGITNTKLDTLGTKIDALLVPTNESNTLATNGNALATAGNDLTAITNTKVDTMIARLDSLITLMTTNNTLTTDSNTKLDAIIAKP
jgi:hypothetical protein